MVNQDLTISARAWQLGLDILNGQHSLSKLISPVLFILDAILCGLVIWKIPYTEIDWRAYMEQVAQVVAGERDYAAIKGGTGPLVYPAAHVYIYTALYYVTDEGRNLLRAQQLFAVLYLATLALVMASYREAKTPPYVFPLLILSKRLHSIFMLRCFNDCFAVFFFWLAIYCFQRRSWTLGVLAFSWGLGVKMTLLLALPAVGIVLLLGRGFYPALRLARLMVQVHLLIALPFLRTNCWTYLSRAFDLSRQFLFKWTVNWRFMGERHFLSREFSVVLLVGHISVLLLFISTRWLTPAGKSFPNLVRPLMQFRPPFAETEQERITPRITPQYILTTTLSATVIGLLFARSLHYQFYAYVAWATPFLLWRSDLHPVLQYALWLAQEWAWNVFPSTQLSSAVVVGSLSLTVGLVWQETAEDDRHSQPTQPGNRSN